MWPKDKNYVASKSREDAGGPFTEPASAAIRSAKSESEPRVSLKKPDVNTYAERPRPFTAGFARPVAKEDYGKGGN